MVTLTGKEARAILDLIGFTYEQLYEGASPDIQEYWDNTNLKTAETKLNQIEDKGEN